LTHVENLFSLSPHRALSPLPAASHTFLYPVKRFHLPFSRRFMSPSRPRFSIPARLPKKPAKKSATKPPGKEAAKKGPNVPFEAAEGAGAEGEA
jgi:hypothetical protein